MYEPRLNVSIADFAVSRAIPELHATREYISETDIANHIGCGRITVNRALKNLINSGRVIRADGPHPRLGGSRYLVFNE